MWRNLVFIFCVMVFSSCDEHTKVLQEVHSVDGRATARFEKTLFGGAAGGESYCLTVSSKRKQNDDCVILGVRLQNAKIAWVDDTVVFRQKGGEITHANDEVCIEDQSNKSCYKIIVTTE